MSAVFTLAPRLAWARMRGGRGGVTLDLFAVIAYVVSTLLALTVAGGTWMFVQRAAQRGRFPDVLTELVDLYPVLAGVACALLVIPVLNLGGAAARLGAKGRERRLAALRLVGMSGKQVVAISLMESAIQGALGIGLGLACYLASLPAWQAVTFQTVRIGPSELLVPWWLGLAIVATLFLLGILSTAYGLRRVRISPLGVARNEPSAALRRWRLAVLGVALVGLLVAMRSFDLLSTQTVPLLVVSAFLAAVIGGINLAGPFVLQLVARLGVRSGNVAQLLAMRRIWDQPKAAWRNVSAVALLSFIWVFTSILPFASRPTAGAPPYVLIVVADIQQGLAITLLVGFVVAAVSVLLSQAAAVFERADQAVALDRMGMARHMFAAIRRREVLLPQAITLAIAVVLAHVASLPLLVYSERAHVELGVDLTGWLLIGAVTAVGLTLTYLAAEACRPIQASVLSEQRRRND